MIISGCSVGSNGTLTTKSIPQRLFFLSEDFVKGDHSEELKSGNFGELSAHKKYINNICVKDITFSYSKDKLLKSFEKNRLVCEINYE
jgi:hypothetical protein